MMPFSVIALFPSVARPYGQAPRRDLAVGSLPQAGLLLACGGYDGQAYLPTVEALDPRTGAWQPRAPLPHPRQLLAVAAAPSGGPELLYALGGFDGVAGSSVVEIYDPRMDRWRAGPALPQPRLGLAAGSVAL